MKKLSQLIIHKITLSTVCLALLSMLLPGCGVFEKKDGAPFWTRSVDHIPNATPKVEPLSRRGNPSSYVVFGKRYYPMRDATGYVERGVASWYGTKFHGRETSTGEKYDLYGMTAAHKTLPLPTYVQVTNLENGKKIIVKVNDRGPFHGNRLIDLSYAAARKLGIYSKGTGRVEVKAINPRQSQPKKKVRAPIKQPQTALYLQVGAFGEHRNAQKAAERYIGLAASHIAEDGALYKLRLGPFDEESEALQMQHKIEQRYGLTPLLIWVER